MPFIEALIPIIGMIMVFGPGFYAIKRIYDLREKKLKSAAEPKQLEGLREDNRLLKERVENLESIVCNVDFELNQRIARLVEGGASLALPPAPAVQAAAAEGASGGGLGTDETAAIERPAPREAPAGLEAGQVLAERYRIERLLGRGGMGAVYLAHDEVLGELVALKVISSAWAADERDMIERFRREASAARKVSSRNVIRIHDLGEARGGLLYLSMEYFPGKTLADLLTARGVLSGPEVADIIGQICDGLQAAHEAGVIHRDLKPHNVLVGERNAVKLIDFGLAKTTFLSGLTATGLMLGTPHYMSPEQVRGREVDARSDIYSLGALTYHAVCGRPPFDGATPIAIGFAHCTEEPTPPRTLQPKVSAELEAEILRALDKDPRKRPASAAEFRAALG